MHGLFMKMHLYFLKTSFYSVLGVENNSSSAQALCVDKVTIECDVFKSLLAAMSACQCTLLIAYTVLKTFLLTMGSKYFRAIL